MARSIAVIKQQIIDIKNADAQLSDKLTSTSQTAIWNLWAYITAVSINLHEQLWDIFRQEIEDIAAKAVPGTTEWFASKVLEFQYDPVNPQVIQLVNFVPTYPDGIKPELRIIKKVSVRQVGRNVQIKVATADSSGELQVVDAGPLGLLNAYIDSIKFAGTIVNATSFPADRIQIFARVYIDRGYDIDLTRAKIVTAIKDYLKNLPFDGIVYVAKMEDAIQAVKGVTDVVISNIRGRSTDPLPTLTSPVSFDSGYTFAYNKDYSTFAGYIIPEDATPGSPTQDYTLNATLDVRYP